MEDMDDIVREFLIESYENLDQLDQDLVALEVTPGSRALLGSIFRTIHTIKGTSGFLAFSRLERVAHAGENLLVELREGRRSMDLPTTDVLLRMVDTVREILASIEVLRVEGDVAVDAVIDEIRDVLEHREAPAVTPAASSMPDVAAVAAVSAPLEAASTPDDAAPADASGLLDAIEVLEAITVIDAIDVLDAVDAKMDSVVAPPEAAAPVPVPAVAPAPVPVPTPEPVTIPVVPAFHSATLAPAATRPTPAFVPAPRPTPAAAVGTETPATAETPATPETAWDGGERRGNAADASIRVDVELLDALMRQVGELVLSRNQISRLADGAVDGELARASQRLSLIASELQEGVMKTRMQPIDHVWAKMPRIVRDLASTCGRQVRLDMVGGDTELDRTLLEAVKDPLTHLVRNAIDHGIESPEARVAAGKPALGVLTLRAYHAGGQVFVEVADDGAGVDTGRVGAKAVERGLRTEAQVAGMSVPDLLQLLFLPGFSTAEVVTNVSGRGVGMDVVRTKIEAIGGTVEVESSPGRGTVWRLRIPLTLAIMPALTVESAGQLYAIPQVSLLELVALDSAKAGTAIEYVNSAPVYRLRGALLPLVGLRDVLEFGQDAEAAATAVIAVLQSDTQRFGLIVDRVLNTEEIVVKPLSLRLKMIGAYTGATLLGDGRVSLILDVQAIARRCLAAEAPDADRAAKAAAVAVAARPVEQVLVAGIGGGRRVAIPLAAVTRLERLRLDLVEHVGGREVVQYRGAIVPLVRLDRLLGGMSDLVAEDLLVVVYTRGARSVAIVVEEIVDIVDDDAARHSQIDDLGLVGSTVLQDRVTELLDVTQAVLAADPAFFTDAVAPDAVAGSEPGAGTGVGAGVPAVQSEFDVLVGV